jgi:hypothetical protein
MPPDDEWNERRAKIEETGSLFVRWHARGITSVGWPSNSARAT